MEFKKSGFNEEDSATLAGVAAMYQNVADDAISAGESANFIISQMKAFGLEAEDATHIIDALNEVSNTQAVSSADLANNLGKASAAMALGNNTYEQSLAMMTAITEINRSGAKSARALVSVQSRLTQVLDEQSSTGKALIEIYDGLGIALKDQNGQLRPTFEIFKDLAKVWPNLTTNQKDYIALTQAGANQTSNFVALMDNFEAALKAEATAMESSGSASRENAAYMESLEAQTTQLKATFQDFANNVIDKELVSSILTLANDALGLLNTETGKTITQWALLTGVFTGGLTIYGQIASKLIGAAKSGLTFASAITGAGTAASGAAVGFGTLATTALPIAAILAGVAIAGWEVYKWYKETHKPLQEYTDEIQANTQQLEQNRDRLAEIEQMSWDKKTPEILEEYDSLVKENEELQRNIDLLEHRRTEQAKRQARKGGEVETGGTYYTAVGFDDATQYKTAEDAYLSLASANYLVVESAEDAKKQLEAMGITLQENAEMVKVDADAYNEDLTASMQNYVDQLNSTHSLNQDQLRDFESLKTEVGERVVGLQQLQAEGETLTDSEQARIAVYEQLIQAEADATDFTEKYGEAQKLTLAQVDLLISKFPEARDQITKVGDAYYYTGNGALNAASSIMDANGNIVADEKATVDAVIAQIQRQLDAYAELIRVKRAVYAGYVKSGQKDSELGRQAEAEWVAAAEAWNEVQQARLNISSALATGRVTYSENRKDTGIGTGASKTTKSKVKKATDLALEEFKNLQKDLEHQRELGLISEEEYYDKLEQLIKDYKAKATAHMKEYGTDVDTINRNMYQYEEEIYKGRAKLAEDLAEKQKKAAEEAAKAQKEALEQQKSDYETAINYVIKQIDKEIDKLQDLRDQTEQYYDDKIDALNDANDELERQIQYEQLLNNLAQAKDKQLYVFQNGQFQYVQDVEAIASAQAELDAYERDEALRKEVENLETLKDQALASIDKQIEGWEKYKEEWEGVTTQYQEQQDKLLAEQVLGIEMEQSNWETRLANVQSFVDQYNSILSQLNSGASTGANASNGSSRSSGGAGATPIGGGLSYDPKTRKFYDIAGNVVSGVSTVALTDEQRAAKLAAEEAYELQHTKDIGGFLDDEGYATADDGKTKIKYTSNASGGSKYSVKSASMERRTDLAGQVVKVGRETITYDDNGYAVSKKIDHHAFGTLSAPGGLSLVGERGPELRVLNSGDGIIPADATRNLWDWASYNPKDFMSGMSNDNIFHIGNIALPNVTDAKSFVNGLKQLAYQRAYKRA